MRDSDPKETLEADLKASESFMNQRTLQLDRYGSGTDGANAIAVWKCGRFNLFCSCQAFFQIPSWIPLSYPSGAISFLFTEYKYVGLFMGIFAVLVFLFHGSVESFGTKSQPCQYSKGRTCKPALANAIFNTIAFVLGVVTPLVSGFLGMKIATYANARKGVGKAFITAFRSGVVMGFPLGASGFFVLHIAINLFGIYYGDDWEGLYEAITGYGLGGSSMALFGHVGGGIYTKTADVGADLVGKVERNIKLKMIRETQLSLQTMLVTLL